MDIEQNVGLGLKNEILFNFTCPKGAKLLTKFRPKCVFCYKMNSIVIPLQNKLNFHSLMLFSVRFALIPDFHLLQQPTEAWRDESVEMMTLTPLGTPPPTYAESEGRGRPGHVTISLSWEPPPLYDMSAKYDARPPRYSSYLRTYIFSHEKTAQRVLAEEDLGLG